MKKLWFKAKKYGWGWTPASWEGWVVIGGYVAFLLRIFEKIDARTTSVSDTVIQFIGPLIFASGVLIGICYLMGEEPHWQWGEKDKNE